MNLYPAKNFGSVNTKRLLWASVLAFSTFKAAAQSSDALLDKLVDKGILTAKEAAELREESDKNFTTAFQTKTGMPDWISGYKLSGDIRGRFEHTGGENTAFIDRERLRYRIRVGLAVNMLDDLEAGFRLISGQTTKGATTGNPLSGNTTLQDNGSKKSIFIDTAYGKWTPLNTAGWTGGITVGKMENPFAFTAMVFDPDYTPEGASVQTSWVINDRHTLSLTAGAFMLDENAAEHDPFMYGGQFLWTAKWTPKLSSVLGGGMLNVKYKEELTTDNVPYINRGNTREPIFLDNSIFYRLKHNYTPLIADASVTYTLDSFPFYTGAFPLKFSGEFIHNPGASEKNHGFWVGATFGKSGTKKTWDITYRYEYLEADAWYDQLVDDDNGAFYPGTIPTAGSTSYGYFGGTNVKGHMIKFNYSFTDSFTFSATCFVTDLISLDGLVSDANVPDGRTSATISFMADLLWKF